MGQLFSPSRRSKRQREAPEGTCTRVCHVLHLPHDGTKPWDSLPGQGTQGQRDQPPEDAGLYDPLQGGETCVTIDTSFLWTLLYVTDTRWDLFIRYH